MTWCCGRNSGRGERPRQATEPVKYMEWGGIQHLEAVSLQAKDSTRLWRTDQWCELRFGPV